MKGRYRGYCLSWETKYAFGQVRPVPHKVYFSTRAMNLEEASQLLSAKAQRQGFALGGVQEIELVERLSFEATVLIPNRQPMHYGNDSVAREDILAWFRVEKPDIKPEITRAGFVTRITAEGTTVLIIKHPPPPEEITE